MFIVGAHRSGTTKLAAFLRDELGIPGDPEGHVLPLAGAIDRHGAPWLRPLDSSFDRIGPFQIRREVVRLLLELLRRRHGPRYFDKTPGAAMIELCPLVAELEPEARFVHLVRNGLDNVLSRRRRFGTGFEEGCREWVAAVGAFRRIRLGNRAVTVRAEDLLADPVAPGQTVVAHLGFEPVGDDRIRTFFAAPSETATRSLTTRRARLLDLPDAEAETFRRICGPEMVRLGYAPFPEGSTDGA